MGQSVVKNPKKLYSQLGGDPTLPTRVTTLENNEYKITYYEVVSGASGSLTLPTGATINAGEFGLSGNCVLSKIDGSNKPTFESPKTSGGTVVTASLNETTGAWVASGTYTDTDVALIYSIKIKAINYSNLTYDSIIETVAEGSAYIKNLTSDAQTQLDGKLNAINMFITTGNQSTTSNVAANITDLVSPTLAANKRYKISGVIHFGCNNSGGIKYQITLPAGATIWIMGHSNLTNANTITWVPIISSGTLSASFSGVNAVDYGALCIEGEIRIGATAGVIQFGFASATNTQTSTVYQLGTQLTLTQIN